MADLAQNDPQAVQENEEQRAQRLLEAEINALSITEAFDDPRAFRAMLSRLGFPTNGVNRLIDQEGLTNARDLSRTRPKNLSDSLESINKLFGAQTRIASRIYFPHARILKLKSLSSYFRRCLTANRIPDIRLIGTDEVSNFEDFLEDWTSKASSIQDVISNNSFKFDATNFTKFRQMIETICSSTRGSRGISLEYLLRVDDNNHAELIEEAVPDVNSQDFMRLNASLRGNDFRTDNKSLYTILRHYLSNTPGWNVISKFSTDSDGRKAYKTLRSHYEGASYYDLMKTKANTLMMKTFYRGDTMRFSWEKFVAVHLEAHRMFSDIGEPLTDSLKILYMKGGIRPEAGLEASMEVAKGLPNVNNSFDLFVNHITESVTNKRSRAEVLKIAQPRSVSGSFSIGRGRGRHFPRGGRSVGRFGRGGRGGRFSRGRGRGRGNYNYGGGAPDHNIPEVITIEGKALYPRKVYHKSEYEQLTYNQKSELAKARRNVSGLNSDANSTTDTRSIRSAVSESIREIMTEQSAAPKNPQNEQDQTCENRTESSISNQFKRRRPNQD